MRRTRTAAIVVLLCTSVAACGSPTAFEIADACLPPLTEPFESELHSGSPGAAEGWTLHERMAAHRVPGVGIAVVRDGEIAFARGYGVKQAGTDDCVDAETVFSVASISKVGAATVTLTMVDDGLVDLDTDVNSYLTSWSVPENALTQQEPPTLRRIMSHTAGFTVHGFSNYQPSQPVPSLVDILEGRPPAMNSPIRVTLLPGSTYRYSGGGVTVEQLVIEDVTGLDLAGAADARVFGPLGMTRSTFEQPLPASHGNIARAHGPNGSLRALPRGWETMPEGAAAGLWTTPSDLGRLIVGLIDSYHGEPGALLSQSLAEDMMTPVAPSAIGLGPDLVVSPNGILFRHGGVNDSYISRMYGLVNTRAGLVVTTNSENGYELIQEIARAVWDAEGWPTE